MGASCRSKRRSDTVRVSTRAIATALGILALIAVPGGPAFSGDIDGLSTGQTVYVSIYSHVFGGPKAFPIYLAATLSIRNTDPSRPITVVSAKYYASEGKVISEYVERPMVVKPLATIHFIVKEHDTTGGAGANFLVTWKSATKVNPPAMEAVHLSTKGGQGISFVTTGYVIRPH